MFTLHIIANGADKRKLFDEVYRHYRKQMIAVAKSILKNDEDAEDAVHDVFCSVASSHIDILDRVDNPKDLKNYMLKAVQNRSISILRHQKVCKEYDAKAANAAREINYNDLIDEICSRTGYDNLIKAIKSLDGKYREVIYYNLVVELSPAEISEIVGRPENTVRKQAQRGKEILIEILKKEDKKCSKSGK